MTRFFPIAAAAAIAIAAPLASADDAKFAEKAPTLDNVTWIQGDAIKSFEKDHVYVLDFWATWCGPCVASIPHLTELHNEHKDTVTFIGVAVRPNDRMTPTAKFVKDQGDKMPYHVCADIDDKTYGTYMTPLDQHGIPTAMIIDKKGRIAWVGHPMGGMDEALEKILASNYDLSSAKADFAKQLDAARAEMEIQEKASKFGAEISRHLEADNFESAIAAIDEAYENYPDFFSGALIYKYTILLTELNQPAQAAKFGAKLVNNIFADDAQMLNAIAWEIATEFSEDVQDLNLAMKAANKADKLTDSKDPGIIDTLARVYFVQGDIDKAIALQKKAIKFAEQENEGFADQLREALNEYMDAKSST